MQNIRKYFTKNEFLMIAAIVALGFTAYSFMLGGGFKVFDDQFSIVDNPHIKNFANTGKIFQSGFFGDRSYYRPLVALSFMLEYRFFELNPFFYNVTNLLLHLATGIIIFFLIRLIFRDRKLGFFVSLLFVIHPIQWEAVSNIAGRAIVLCGFFFMSAFLFYCLWDIKTKSAFYYWLSILFFSFALLCKESAVVFPLILLAFEQFPAGRETRGNRLSWFKTLPFFLAVIFYFFIRRIFGITAIFYWSSLRELILGVVSFLNAAITYVRLFFLPVDLYFDRAAAVLTSFADPRALDTLFFAALAVFVFFKIKKRLNNRPLFFLFWFCLGLLPVMQFVPIELQPGYISTAEHFLYIPSLGIFVLLVLVFRWFYHEGIRLKLFTKEVFCVAAVFIYAFFFIITVEQNIYASQELAMYKRSVAYYPMNARVQNALGLSYAKKRLFREAEEHFRRALAFDPNDTVARISLGKALCDQGRLVDGAAEYEKIADAGKWAGLLSNNMRLSYEMLAKQYRASLGKDPSNAKLRYSLGVAYSKAGKTREAIEEYQKAVSLDPRLKNAIFNLAVSYESLDELRTAAAFYEKALASQEKDTVLDARACFRLGLIYGRLGDKDKSENYLNKSFEMNPAFKEAAEKLRGQKK